MSVSYEKLKPCNYYEVRMTGAGHLVLKAGDQVMKLNPKVTVALVKWLERNSPIVRRRKVQQEMRQYRNGCKDADTSWRASDSGGYR